MTKNLYAIRLLVVAGASALLFSGCIGNSSSKSGLAEQKSAGNCAGSSAVAPVVGLRCTLPDGGDIYATADAADRADVNALTRLAVVTGGDCTITNVRAADFECKAIESDILTTGYPGLTNASDMIPAGTPIYVHRFR